MRSISAIYLSSGWNNLLPLFLMLPILLLLQPLATGSGNRVSADVEVVAAVAQQQQWPLEVGHSAAAAVANGDHLLAASRWPTSGSNLRAPRSRPARQTVAETDGALNKDAAAAAEAMASPLATKLTLDERLTQLLKSSGLTDLEPVDETLTGEWRRMGRVLSFATNSMVRERAPSASRRENPPDVDDDPPVLRSDTSSASASSPATGGGLVASLRQRSGNLLVGRLAKKTDWNALFVKLAKVFLQYFLDLILNDMFGTTGE